MSFMFNNKCNVDVVVDLQFGSTGKGLFCGYISRINKYDTVVSVNMPNAGHTFVDSDGEKYVFKILPTSALSPFVERVLIGPGAVFEIDQLQAEISSLRTQNKSARILIHENAWILRPEHKAVEQNQGLGSTRSGAGAALVAKMARGNGWNCDSADFWRGHLDNIGAYVVKHRDWRTLISAADQILLEGAQGWSLSLNGPFYPHTTTRDCTPDRFMSDAMIPGSMRRHVYGVMRTYPIRVAGESGGWYTGQKELSWEAIDQPEERTTVTNKVRRVAEFSKEQIEEAVWHCRPDSVFLNFANYDRRLATDIEFWYNNKFDPFSVVSHIGWGPGVKDIAECGHHA